jgi:tetratricopeptide (TPR) repeat protein
MQVNGHDFLNEPAMKMLLLDGDNQEAIEAIEAVPPQNRDNDLWAALGSLYVQVGRHDEAWDIWQHYHEPGEPESAYLLRLGYWLYFMGRYSPAKEMFEDAIAAGDNAEYLDYLQLMVKASKKKLRKQAKKEKKHPKPDPAPTGLAP